MTNHPLIAAALCAFAGLALFLFGIGRPATIYFDEGYFVPEARAFIQGIPNPNPQCPPLAKPPLGKLLMAMAMEVAGDTPFGWRLGSAISGALTLAAVYLWTFLLLRNSQIAFLAAGLALFNNFVFVISRIGMMDAFLMVFLMWSLVAFTAALTLDIGLTLRRCLVGAAGVLVGLAGACKWNAVDTLAVYFVVSFALLWLSRRRNDNSSLWQYAQRVREIGLPTILLGLGIAPIAAYTLAFWPLCRIIHRPFTLHELVAMNVFIWKFNSTSVSNRLITSAWHTWPLKLSPQRSFSYLVGNPVVTFGGLAAVALCAKRLRKTSGFAEGLVLLLFAANYLQWAVTPEKGLFYYYYYPSVMMLGVAIAISLRQLPERILGVRTGLLVLLAALVVFTWCYPRMANLEAPWDCVFGCWQ